MMICQQNIFYAQELEKRVYTKEIKLKSNAYSKNIWLNSNYIKTKGNCKFKNMLFRIF